jgi:hypothetical protein
MKRKTSNRRLQHRNVLEVRVMSPRIAWFGFLRFFGVLAKLACLAAVLTGIGWGVWRGIEYAFYQNPDFSLKVIDLNPNPVIDEPGLVEFLEIDLTADPSLFVIDAGEASEKLMKLPAVTDARVERHLPGTLMVRIAARTPKAWLRCGEENKQTREAGGLLVDHHKIAYPCPELQWTDAVSLPVIELDGAPPAIGQKVDDPSLDHCLRLLDAARAADPEAVRWIESIRQANEWSLELVTRQGTRATFGLGDHERQMQGLRDALDHAADKGYVIETINLIPKYNIPITVRGENTPPRAVVVSPPPSPGGGQSRRERDLGTILNRN